MILFFAIAAVKIKRNKENVKFKVRCSRYLYTFTLKDKEKADKIKQSLPPGNNRPRVPHICLPVTASLSFSILMTEWRNWAASLFVLQESPSRNSIWRKKRRVKSERRCCF